MSPAISSPTIIATYNLPTFFLSVVVLLYLFTFVVFAVLRIITGLTIQRVGYLSLKRLSFEPRSNVKVEIRKLGLLLHRPTFAQPTWVSVVVQDSHITLDLRGKHEEAEEKMAGREDENGEKNTPEQQLNSFGSSRKEKTKDHEKLVKQEDDKKNKVEEGIERVTASLKKVYRWIDWIRLVDIVVTNTTITVTDVGSVQVGSVTMMIDTRMKAGDRNGMFDHCTELGESQHPIEWICTAKSVLFICDKKDPTELLDHSMFNVYGVLQDTEEIIRDIAMAFKFGRITLPYDELLNCAKILKCVQKHAKRNASNRERFGSSLDSVLEEIPLPGSMAERMAEVVLESKVLLHSFLEGVKEIQFAIGYLLVSKEFVNIQPTGQPLKVMVGLKELGMDLHQLDQKSPAHRMYVYLNSL
jgi:hypothetical protein